MLYGSLRYISSTNLEYLIRSSLTMANYSSTHHFISSWKNITSIMSILLGTNLKRMDRSLRQDLLQDIEKDGL